MVKNRLRLFKFTLIVMFLLCIIFFFMTHNDTNKIESKKFIVFDIIGYGWGDRLCGIMVAYALSLLTNRQLIINLKNPCYFNRIFSPKKINWHLGQDILNEKSSTNVTCTGDKWPDCFKAFKIIKNFKEDVIYFSGADQRLIDIYLANEINFKKEILNLGLVNRTDDFNLKNLFHNWYNDLFELEPQLEKKYNLIKQQAKLNEKTLIFCAQIRIGGQRPEVSIDAQFNHRNITKLFWEFIRENFIKNSSNNQNWKLFVTSDLEEVEMEAIDEFGKENVIRIPGTSSHIGREKNLANNCSRIEKPILDFHFLQNCDKAVISQSSFGRLGTWNRLRPEKDLHFLGSHWTNFHANRSQNFEYLKLFSKVK